MFEHIESVEALSDGRLRIVAVVPADCFDEIGSLLDLLLHASRFLRTRSRCAKAMSALTKYYLVNEELKHVR